MSGFTGLRNEWFEREKASPPVPAYVAHRSWGESH